MIINIEINPEDKFTPVRLEVQGDQSISDLPGFHHFIKIQLEEYFTKRIKEENK